MFTGIIEELGEVKSIISRSDKSRIRIAAPKIAKDLAVGESVAVNGVCLTAVKFEGDCFLADVMPETIRKTNLFRLRPGEKVNLERALKVSDRFGGHFVLGHIDAVGPIIDKKREGNSIIVKTAASREILDYLVPKGPIALDGISLTIMDLYDDSFTVSMIPHTAEMTTLGHKSKGAELNVEVDIISKYVRKSTNPGKESGSTLDLLSKYGYLERGGAR